MPIAGAFAALAVIGILFVALASGGGDGDGTQGNGQGTGLKGETPLPSPEATLDLTQPTAVGSPDPNAPVPGMAGGDRLVISKFGVNAPVSYKTVPPDGVMPNPNGADDVVYYDFKNHDGLGGVPGFGNIVMSGHVDWGGRDGTGCKNNTVRPPCQAVFWDIGNLRVGDEIELNVSGQTFTYRVTSNQSVDAATGDWERIVSATQQQTITLITCGGDFNPVTREYNHRQVVTGVRV